MSGRPRALDEVKRREVCALVSAGCGIEAAARYVGCNPITIRRESMRNPVFYGQLRSAELGAQITPLQALRKAADTHWRAAAWFLERTQPNQFARREPDAIKPHELELCVSQIVDVLLEEVRDPSAHDRIQGRIDGIMNNYARIDRSIEAPRPDVHSRRKQQAERIKRHQAAIASHRSPAVDQSAEIDDELDEPGVPGSFCDTYPGPGPTAPVLPAKPCPFPSPDPASNIEQNATPLCPS